MEPNPLTVQIDFSYWRSGLFLGLLFCAYLLSRKIKIPQSALCLWLYAVGSSLMLTEYTHRTFGMYHTAYQASAGSSLAAIILIPTAVIFATDSMHRVACWIVAGQILMVSVLGYGLMYRISADTALLALSLPVIPWPLSLVSVVVIALKGGVTAALIVVSQVVFFLLRSRSKRLAGSIVLILGTIAMVKLSHGRWNERIDKWAQMVALLMTDWKDVVFGKGAGSFMWQSLQASNFKPPLFLTMHNDILQIWFEYGFIGILLSGMVLFEVGLTPAIAGSIVFMATYHPLHFFPSSLIVALIFFDAYKKGRNN